MSSKTENKGVLVSLAERRNKLKDAEQEGVVAVFDDIIEKNKQKKVREAKERTKSNRNVIRSYRLKP